MDRRSGFADQVTSDQVVFLPSVSLGNAVPARTKMITRAFRLERYGPDVRQVVPLPPDALIGVAVSAMFADSSMVMMRVRRVGRTDRFLLSGRRLAR